MKPPPAPASMETATHLGASLGRRAAGKEMELNKASNVGKADERQQEKQKDYQEKE